MTVKELKEKSVRELRKMLDEQKTLAQRLYVDVTVKQEKSHQKYRAARKAIARILTVMAQKNAQDAQK